MLSSSLDVGSRTANIASYVLLGRLLTFAMTGIALIVVTRLLGPTQYGIYTLAVAFAGIFGSIGYFGVGSTLNKFISEYKQLKKNDEISLVVSNSLFLVVSIGIVLTGLSFIFSSQISQYVFHTTSLSYIIQVISFWIITAMLFGAFYDALLGFVN